MALVAMAAGRGQPSGGRIVRSLQTLRGRLPHDVALAYNDRLSLADTRLRAATMNTRTAVLADCDNDKANHGRTLSTTLQTNANMCRVSRAAHHTQHVFAQCRTNH